MSTQPEKDKPLIRNVPRQVFTEHLDRVKSITFSPDSQIFASGSYDDTIKIWDIDSRKLIHNLDWDAWGSIIAFSSDGKTISTVNSHNLISTWDVKTGEIISEFLSSAPNGSGAVAFSPNGKIFANFVENDIMLWDIETGQIVRTLSDNTNKSNLAIDHGQNIEKKVSQNRLLNMSFSGDGQSLVSITADGKCLSKIICIFI